MFYRLYKTYGPPKGGHLDVFVQLVGRTRPPRCFSRPFEAAHFFLISFFGINNGPFFEHTAVKGESVCRKYVWCSLIGPENIHICQPDYLHLLRPEYHKIIKQIYGICLKINIIIHSNTFWHKQIMLYFMLIDFIQV